MVAESRIGQIEEKKITLQKLLPMPHLYELRSDLARN